MNGWIELLLLLLVSRASSPAEDQLAARRQNSPNPPMGFRPHPRWGGMGNALSKEDIPPTWDMMNFIEALDPGGNGCLHPDLNQETPYVVMRPQR